MKKSKHITINLTEQENADILELAEQEERTPAQMARLLLIKAVRKLKEN